MTMLKLMNQNTKEVYTCWYDLTPQELKDPQAWVDKFSIANRWPDAYEVVEVEGKPLLPAQAAAPCLFPRGQYYASAYESRNAVVNLHHSKQEKVAQDPSAIRDRDHKPSTSVQGRTPFDPFKGFEVEFYEDLAEIEKPNFAADGAAHPLQRFK